ncbi:MAG: prephenate/arogenate dehydrogenase family protein [Alphaproteobacteria bacterium]|nr:prephenate/arogenate dehydrogenase family protein [Alphaproteobacteria bacterium]
MSATDASRQVFARVAIVGVGLIGSSIARAATEKGAAGAVSLFDADAGALGRAGELGLGEIRDTIAEAVRDADAVFLCIPVGAIGQAAAACIGAMKSGAILTDVGSVKGNVARDLKALGRRDVHVIPGHPIAGTERSGPDAGFASLFEGRWCILTPEAGEISGHGAGYDAAVDRLASFWEALGSRVERMDATRHDLVLAITSHVPHLIAYNIVATAHDMESVTEGEVVKFSAAGFRDFTRIAASDPTMWRDVFLNNREAVLEVLGRFDDDLTALRKAIRNGDGATLFNLFTHARGIRREIIEAGQDISAPNFGRDESKT